MKIKVWGIIIFVVGEVEGRGFGVGEIKVV